MIVAHLIGGNEIFGIYDGVVIVNGKELKTSYRDLAYVCGSISLGDLDTSITLLRDAEDVERDYIDMVEQFDSKLDENFVIDNYLTKEVSYSTYKVDFEKKTLILEIDIYC